MTTTTTTYVLIGAAVVVVLVAVLLLRPAWRVRLTAALRFIAAMEPARVQGFWRLLIGVALAAGATVPDWLDVRVSATIAAVYAVLTLWQAEATRKRVVPLARVEQRAAELSASGQVQAAVAAEVVSTAAVQVAAAGPDAVVITTDQQAYPTS